MNHALVDLLERVRRENVTAYRSKWGDCELVSEEFLTEARRAGLADKSDCIVWGWRKYDESYATRRHIEDTEGEHQWVLIDNVIYDGTSDQFSDDRLTIVPHADPRYREKTRLHYTFRTAQRVVSRYLQSR